MSMEPKPEPLLRFSVGRLNDNELILFDEAARESWIVYPPRSAYPELKLRRAATTDTVVERHPWTPMARPTDHLVRAAEACTVHGLDCQATEAIQAAVQLGYDPFR